MINLNQTANYKKKNIPTIMRVKEQGQPTLYNFYQQTIDKDDSDDNDSDSTNEFIVQNCFFSTYTPEDLPQEFSQDRFYKIYRKILKQVITFMENQHQCQYMVALCMHVKIISMKNIIHLFQDKIRQLKVKKVVICSKRNA